MSRAPAPPPPGSPPSAGAACAARVLGRAAAAATAATTSPATGDAVALALPSHIYEDKEQAIEIVRGLRSGRIALGG